MAGVAVRIGAIKRSAGASAFLFFSVFSVVISASSVRDALSHNGTAGRTPSIYDDGFATKAKRLLAFENSGRLKFIDEYCDISTDGGEFTSEHADQFSRWIFRGGPVGFKFVKGLAAGFGGSFWIDKILWDRQFYSQDWESSWEEISHSKHFILCCFFGLVILIFIFLFFLMLPSCCSRRWRNCWSWTSCHKGCCNDYREDMPVLVETSRTKRNIFWIASITAEVAFAFFACLALAVSIKLIWIPTGALCQVGRFTYELDNGILYNQHPDESAWLSGLPEGARYGGLKYISSMLTQLAPVELPALAGVDPLGTVGDWVDIPRVQSFVDDAIEYLGEDISNAVETADHDFVSWIAEFFFAPFVAFSACLVLSLLFVVIILVLMHFAFKKDEINHRAYARWFGFCWGWFALTTIFFSIFGIAILAVQSPIAAICNVVHAAPDDLSVLANHKFASGYYEDQYVRRVLDSCFANAGDGWLVYDLALEYSRMDGSLLPPGFPFERKGAAPARELQSLDDLVELIRHHIEAFLAANLKIGSLNCKSLAYSGGAMIDGLCSGLQQSVFWVGFSWSFAALVSIWFWLTSYKLYHYFKDSAIFVKERCRDETQVVLVEKEESLHRSHTGVAP